MANSVKIKTTKNTKIKPPSNTVKKKPGRPVGSGYQRGSADTKPKKKEKFEKIECIEIKGKKVCPRCKTQDGFIPGEHDYKIKGGIKYILSEVKCIDCKVIMTIETLLSDI